MGFFLFFIWIYQIFVLSLYSQTKNNIMKNIKSILTSVGIVAPIIGVYLLIVLINHLYLFGFNEPVILSIGVIELIACIIMSYFAYFKK
jgi:hypothetical protein